MVKKKLIINNKDEDNNNNSNNTSNNYYHHTHHVPEAGNPCSPLSACAPSTFRNNPKSPAAIHNRRTKARHPIHSATPWGPCPVARTGICPSRVPCRRYCHTYCPPRTSGHRPHRSSTGCPTLDLCCGKGG